MAKPVGRGEIVFGRVVFHHSAHDHIHLGIGRIREEYRFDIGILIAHVDHPVFFFVGTGQFVLFNLTGQVIVEMTGGYQPVLRPSVHRLGIDVIFLRIVLHEPPFFTPFLEILDSFIVNLGAMFVGDRAEIDLRFYDVQQRFFGRFLARLLRIEHVVRARRHLGGILLRRANPFERFYSYHEITIYN